MVYQKDLLKEGFPESRVQSLADAIDQLHSAICNLDDTNFKRFMSKPITERLNDFAKSEGLKVIFTKD